MGVDQAKLGPILEAVFSILYRVPASMARLAVRSGRSKDLEIIVLRHQLGLLRRDNNSPALIDNGRSVLSPIAQALPRPRRNGCLVTPEPCCAGIAGASPGPGPNRSAQEWRGAAIVRWWIGSLFCCRLGRRQSISGHLVKMTSPTKATGPLSPPVRPSIEVERVDRAHLSPAKSSSRRRCRTERWSRPGRVGR